MEFSRLEILMNIDNLKNKKVLVIGVGGVGGYAVEALARCGIGNITIVDYDKVDISNINRQIIALHSTIGLFKVEVLKKRILDINPNCLVETFNCFYDEKTTDLIFNKDYDYILDCCDSLKSKELLIREANKRNIKIISSMGAGFKFDPSKIQIEKLKNTSYDKLARILRYNLKDNKKCLEIPVVYSKEQMEKKGTTIGSNAFIPSIFGLTMVSYIINDIRKENYEEN
ncbi:MAG: tRNA threonylcarbamoyladenosine dehydratase [Erysipelotrichaceae bacterium]|nr:tRNA threonylcarbamoyladenosine dehydratase [Erysipelotrichaceae bacterium]